MALDHSLARKVYKPVFKIDDIFLIALEAGRIILPFQKTRAKVSIKEDSSPVTEADLASHKYIDACLKSLISEYPVLSEESEKLVGYDSRKDWETLWIVDPLDGTKEFIAGSDEYTVNIALIHQNRPVLGVIYAPALNVLYYAEKGAGAWRVKGNDDAQQIKVQPLQDCIRVVASKSHLNDETAGYIRSLKVSGKQVTTCQAGSSLKFVRVAEGAADCYPRFGRTMEWDIAAGCIIAEEAGATVAQTSGELLHFNKADLANPFFLVTATR